MDDDDDVLISKNSLITPSSCPTLFLPFSLSDPFKCTLLRPTYTKNTYVYENQSSTEVYRYANDIFFPPSSLPPLASLPARDQPASSISPSFPSFLFLFFALSRAKVTL